LIFVGLVQPPVGQEKKLCYVSAHRYPFQIPAPSPQTTGARVPAEAISVAFIKAGPLGAGCFIPISITTPIASALKNNYVKSFVF
jgi:hypothetical protein